MPELALNVLLIEDNPGDAELVRQMLADTGAKSIGLDWVEALLPALDRLARGGIDLVLLDLSLPDSQGLSALHAIRLHAPDLPVVILTGYDNEAVAVEAVESGVQDYLHKSRLNGETLVRSIRYALARQKPQTGRAGVGAPVLAKIVGFLGAKGGVGTTTICCHMATEMQRRVDRVLLVDLDTAGDAISFLLKAESPHTLLDATNNILRLDVDFWDKIVGKSSAGLDVLSLHAAKQIGQSLASLHVPPEGIHLVLNRVPKHYFMSTEELYRFVGVPVYATLPEEGTAVNEAYEAGKLLSRERAFCKGIGRIGTKLYGAEEKEPAKAPSFFAHKLQRQFH